LTRAVPGSFGHPSLLFKLNASTGAKAWEIALNGMVNTGAMAVGGDGTVYVPLGDSVSKCLVSVSASGSIR